MMKYLNLIWKFLNSKIFIIILIASGVLFFINTCSDNLNLKKSIKTNEKNIEVKGDSITTIVDKYGKIKNSISVYKSSVEKLEKYNKQLSEDVKKEKGKVITYSNLVFKLKQDNKDLQDALTEALTKYYPPIQTSDSTWDIDWKLPYIYDSVNYDIFKGRTQVTLSLNNFIYSLKHNKTFLLNRDSQIKLSWGQKYEDNRVKVFVNTKHPAFQSQLMEGVYVDFPKKKHWFTGFGVGPSINIGYDFTRGQTAIVIGGSLHYNIYNW